MDALGQTLQPIIFANSHGIFWAATDDAVLCEHHSIIYFSVNNKQRRRLGVILFDCFGIVRFCC